MQELRLILWSKKKYEHFMYIVVDFRVCELDFHFVFEWKQTDASKGGKCNHNIQKP